MSKHLKALKNVFVSIDKEEIRLCVSCLCFLSGGKLIFVIIDIKNIDKEVLGMCVFFPYLPSERKAHSRNQMKTFM